MRLLPKIFFNFTQQTAAYRQIFTSHIYQIIQQDETASIHKYLPCRAYFDAVIANCPQQQAKLKCNLIFNTYCLGDSLSELRGIIAELIVEGAIRSQYELDQIGRWLTREIKVNKDVGRADIVTKLGRRDEEAKQFERQVETLEKYSNKGQIVKQMRQKYFTIDSKIIFDRVNHKLAQATNKPTPKKDNKLWDKLLDIKPRQLKQECNSKQIYEQHLLITGGKPRFRFPPQPNGYLHIGHVKSIRINFQSALRMGGSCYLRYDDTNPDKQTHEFIQQIEDNVRWLGYTPDKITFASDYFEQIMHYAHQLIKEGKAYVCESSQDEIEAERKNKQENPFRKRSIEDSLRIFPNLTGNQTLRLKGIHDSSNPTLRDPIIYRLKQKPHPRTGNKYKIYPMYDFTHCICDSLEHIDFSLCSLEFQIRRELYYTILDMLGLFKPVVWEYSRLNIEGNVLSKRKIKDFIEKGIVEGWNDPRLLTIRGLQNRGYTSQMLKQFIDKVNCSRTGNENVVQYNLLEKEMKKVLLAQAHRTMGVIHPIKVEIENVGSSLKVKSKEGKQITLERNIFIESGDAIELKQGDKVILKYAGVFDVIRRDNQLVKLHFLPNQNIAELRKNNNKVKIIHWVSEASSCAFPVVLYDRLLDSKSQVNPNSKTNLTNSRIPSSVLQQNHNYFQFERIGFFKLSTNRKELQLCTRI